MKKKIYSVLTGHNSENMGIFGSKTKLCEMLFDIALVMYHDNMEDRIDTEGNICFNCKKKFDRINLQSLYLYCSQCDLIYCNKCVNTCVKCNKKLISHDETHINLKNEMKKQIKTDATSLDRFLYETWWVEEEIIEFSDDESDDNSDIEESNKV